MRVPILLGALTALAACGPADGPPLAQAFAGWWRPDASRGGCEDRAFRFERNTIVLRRYGRSITTFTIDNATLNNHGAELALTVADEAAALAAIETRQAAMRAELPKQQLLLTLSASGDRIRPGNVLIREDGPRGLRAPRRGEADAISKVFTMSRCLV